MQHTHRRLISSLLAAPLVLAGSLLVGTGVAGPNGNPSPGAAIRALREASSLSIDAAVEFRNVDSGSFPAVASDGLPIDGYFSYRSTGNAWRVASLLNPSRFKGMNTDLSFDGQQQFTARAGDEIAFISEAGEPSDLGMTLPNPLFALASYARPISDANIANALKLSDLRQMTDTALDISAAMWEPVHVDGVDYERATLPGDVVGGVRYSQQVFVFPGKRTEPVFIDRVVEDGGLLTRFEFESWKAADDAPAGVPATVRFPRTVRLKDFRPSDGTMLHVAIFELTSVKLNSPLPNLDLVVDTQSTKHLVQSDFGEYLR